jgi:hypothetical protein
MYTFATIDTFATYNGYNAFRKYNLCLTNFAKTFFRKEEKFLKS